MRDPDTGVEVYMTCPFCHTQFRDDEREEYEKHVEECVKLDKMREEYGLNK